MALTPNQLYQTLAQNRASGGFPFGGVPYDGLAQGVASGVIQWGINQPTNLALKGVATGQPGMGMIEAASSKLVIPPTVGVVVSALSGAGMQGPLSLSLATAVTMGISQGFSSYGQYSGVAAGISVGQDVSKVIVANGPALVGILQGTLRASLGAGAALSMMAQGLGIGIASLLLLGVGTASVTLPATPPVVAGVPVPGTTNSVVV